MTLQAMRMESHPQTTTSLFFKERLAQPLFQRIAKRIAKENDIAIEEAEKILDGAIGFLLLCAADPTGNYSPSPIVDIGWHAFLMYTKEYSLFCNEVAGCFIHHNPCDIEGESGSLACNTPMAFIKYDLPFHAAQWALSATNCNNHCENNDGCNSKVETVPARTCSGNGCMNNG